MKQIPTINETVDRGFEVPPCSRLDLLLYADAIHGAVGYDGSAAFPILGFMELILPQVYPDVAFEVVPPGSLGDKFGETFPAEHLIRLTQDIYDAAAAGDGFSRMTVAHEVAHLLWHEKVPIALARKRAGRDLPAYRSSEWQANALAGALLMPIRKVIHMDPYEVQEKYLVSPSAARIQTAKVRKSYKEFESAKGESMETIS